MTTNPPGGALVLFSGGQDSATCLAWALDRFAQVETLGFEYGQRHRVELDCRAAFRARVAERSPHWAARLGPDHTLTLDALCAVSDTALTRDVAITMEANGLPSTFVPGRNLLFFTFAAALAIRRGLKHLVGGMCETDYSGYPDCRDDTLKALQVVLNLGMAPGEMGPGKMGPGHRSRFVLHTPLMWLDKAATWRLAAALGGTALVEAIIEDTHTCYLGDRSHRHAWGYGCGGCPACDLRRRGWEGYRAAPAQEGTA